MGLASSQASSEYLQMLVDIGVWFVESALIGRVLKRNQVTALHFHALPFGDKPTQGHHERSHPFRNVCPWTKNHGRGPGQVLETILLKAALVRFHDSWPRGYMTLKNQSRLLWDVQSN